MHVNNNPLLGLQPGILGILLWLKCRMVRDCARKPSTGKLYDVCLCGDTHSSGRVVDGLSATAVY